MPRLSLPFTCVVLLLFAVPAVAQPFETAGARALGMGGAFVGVADDVTAIWWNPAGLASGSFFGLAVERSTFERRSPALFGAPQPAERSSWFIGAGSLPLGLSYVRTRETSFVSGPADEAIVRNLVTHQAGLTLLQSVTDVLVVAGTIKYVRGIASSAPVGTEPEDAAGHALDVDLAVMAVAGSLKAGLTLKNVTSPAFEAPDGTTLELPWLARAGVSYLALDDLTVAVDVDLRAMQEGLDRRRNLALGAEWELNGFTRFAVRAGARFDTIGPSNPLGTVGASFAVRNGIWVDVWAAGGARDAERGWGLAGRVVY